MITANLSVCKRLRHVQRYKCRHLAGRRNFLFGRHPANSRKTTGNQDLQDKCPVMGHITIGIC